MATIIKSNNVAVNHLGSVLPSLLPQNGLKGFFDFSNGNYLSNGNKVAITDVIKVARSTTAIGIGKDGLEYSYAINTPRFHFVKSKNAYGLTFGDVMRNHFINSDAPVTQTITIDEGNERKWFLYVQVVGGGSVTLSGAVSGVATQGNPLILKVTQAQLTLTATVTGTPTYVQVSKVSTPYGIDPSRRSTGGISSQKVQDVSSVNRELFDTYKGANGAITVFMKTVRFDGGDLTLTPNGLAKNIMLFNSDIGQGGYVGLLEMINGKLGNLYVRNQKSGSVLATSGKVEVPVTDVSVIGFNMDNEAANVTYNGNSVSLAGVASSPTMNILPSIIDPVNSELISPNCVLTKMVVYNRVLTSSEMQEVYNILK